MRDSTKTVPLKLLNNEYQSPRGFFGQTKASLRRNAGGSFIIIYLFLISVFMRRL